MLGWVGVALVVAAVGLVGRWVVRRTDALGRARPFPMVSTALLLVAAVGCAIPVIRHARLEHRLTAAVDQVTGDDALRVHCQTTGEAAVDAGPELGLVHFGADGRPQGPAVLKHAACHDLSAWLGSDQRQVAQLPEPAPQKQLIAVHVLTHEAMHLTGTHEEAVTECRAMQRDARMAQALGASAEYGQALAHWYWREIYPRMSDAYRTADCAPGGRLDEHLADPPW